MRVIEPHWWDGHYWRDNRQIDTVWSDLLNLRPKDADLVRAQLTLLKAFGNVRAKVVPNGAPELREYEQRLYHWFSTQPLGEG